MPKGSEEMVASIIRTAFAQPDAAHVNTQFDEVIRMLTKSHPKVAVMLEDAWADVLAFRIPGQALAADLVHEPDGTGQQPDGTGQKEIKRRTDVVGVFPIAQHCCVWPARSSWSNTTSGKPATGATLSEASMADLATMNTACATPIKDTVLLPELTAA